MTLPVFEAAGLDRCFTDLQPGDCAVLSGDTAHHALRVKRLRPPELFDLTDRQGRRATCRVLDCAGLASDQLRLEVLHVLEEPLVTPALGLVQALAKNGRDLQSVEAAVELGVNQILPWQAQRSVVVWKGKKQAAGLKKWDNQIVAAAKQSRRALWPQLHPLETSADLAKRISQRAEDELFIILESSCQQGLLAAVADTPQPPQMIWVVVGPEGGISPPELAQFSQAGAKTARLGTTILRSSSAAPAALAAIGAHLQIWEKCWAQSGPNHPPASWANEEAKW